MGPLTLLGKILLIVINLTMLLLTVRIILSWFSLPYNRFTNILNIITDPIFNLSRRVFPLRFGVLDLSIIFPLIILAIAARIVNDTMISSIGYINIFYLLGLIVSIIEMAATFILGIFMFFVVILIIVNIVAADIYNPFIAALKSSIDPVIDFLDRIFKISYQNSKRLLIYYIIIIVLCIIAGLILKIGFGILLGYSNNLRFS